MNKFWKALGSLPVQRRGRHRRVRFWRALAVHSLCPP
jgi:hypothetical protein